MAIDRDDRPASRDQRSMTTLGIVLAVIVLVLVAMFALGRDGTGVRDATGVTPSSGINNTTTTKSPTTTAPITTPAPSTAPANR